MPLTIDLFDLLKAAGPILMGFIAVLFTVMRLLVSQFEKRLDARFLVQEKSQKDAQIHMDSRFSSLEKAMAKGNEEALRIERELSKLKEELPTNYVRRDDYIRNQSTIETKIDGLALTIQNAILKGERHG
jgi:hypothetical protein